MAVTAEQVDQEASICTTGASAISAWPLTAIFIRPLLTLCELLKWMENSDYPTLSFSCSGHIKMSNVCGAIQPMREYIIPLRLSWQWWMYTAQALQSHPPAHSFIMTPLSCLHIMLSEQRSMGTGILCHAFTTFHPKWCLFVLCKSPWLKKCRLLSLPDNNLHWRHTI